MKTKRTTDDFIHELDCISTTMSAVAYALNGNTEEIDLTKSSVKDILFGLCNHIDRIVEDMSNCE